MAEADFVHALKRRRQVSITVAGRRTGRAITVPVWFVADEFTLWLLPVYGSETQWYRNLEKNRGITVQAGTRTQEFRARLLKDPAEVSTLVERFREKYTPGEIKRWYKGLDVGVQIRLSSRTSPTAAPAGT